MAIPSIVVVKTRSVGTAPETVAVCDAANGPAAVYVSAPEVTAQASVNGVLGSLATTVMTPFAAEAATRILTGRPEVGSVAVVALIIAAMLPASAAASVSRATAVYRRAAPLIVVVSTLPT